MSLIIALSTAVTIGFTGYVYYRLVQDPLAKFPGPRTAALTRLYEGYYDYWRRGQYTFKIAELHKQYGPIIRISPYELHVNDPAFYEVIYRQSGRWDKYSFTYGAFNADSSVICSLDHDLHRNRRAALASFYSKASVTARLGLIRRHVEKLSDRINEFSQSGTLIHIGAAFSAMTADISTEITLGKSYGNLEQDTFNRSMLDMNQDAGMMWQGTKHVPKFRTLTGLLMMIGSTFGSAPDPNLQAFFAFHGSNTMVAKALFDQRQAKPKISSAPHTLVDQIMDSNLPDAEKTLERVMDDVHTIVGAGLDTTGHTLRVITYWIYSTPKILQKLRSELAEHIPPDGAWNVVKLEQLNYLTGVIMEGIRLNPGIVTRTARIAPDREIRYNDWIVPAGTPIGMTAFLMHHDEDLYPNPRQFDPERWVDPEKRRIADKTFGGFSRGTRNCLGMHLAWAELYLTTATIVTRFDLDLESTQASDVECGGDGYAMFTKTKNGVRAKVRRLSSN